MTRRLSEKLGLSVGKRCILVNAPARAASTIGLSAHEQAKRLIGRFDYIHLFATRLSNLDTKLPQLKRHLSSAGTLWVSWPKARGRGTDVTLKDVIRLAYDTGLVESKTIAFDEVWSAIKLTHPKPGKVYRNSYGRLPETGP